MAEKLGFISVRQHAEHGYFGGFLILNSLGRPLEFHCTVPVKPSRAQVVLYGPTINDFVCGEQIAMALITKAKLKPSVVFTDCAPVLALCHVSDKAPILVADGQDVGNSKEAEALSNPNSSISTRGINAGGNKFVVPVDSKIESTSLETTLDSLSANFELSEPFQRIIDALLEAHPIAKAA